MTTDSGDWEGSGGWDDDLVARALDGDVDAARQLFDAASQELVDDVFQGAPGSDGRLFEVLVAAIRTDDPRLRTRARRALEERGWDKKAFQVLAEEDEYDYDNQNHDHEIN